MRYFYAIIVTAFLLTPFHAFAETKEIIAEGAYNMGDGETPTVAESRALLQAKRTAVEEGKRKIAGQVRRDSEGLILWD